MGIFSCAPNARARAQGKVDKSPVDLLQKEAFF